MQTPQNQQFDRHPRAMTTTMAGWDIGLAAFALACMTAGFWRLWPGAVSLADMPVGPLLLKAGLGALGFVAIATRWEDTLRALSRNPLILVFMALVCSSAIWAIIPADALRYAILLIVVWCFGVALALRFPVSALSEICAFAGLFGLLAQFVAHRSLPPTSAFDGDLAFAIMAGAWAALCVPSRRGLWLLVVCACGALALAARDTASLGGLIGMAIGLGVAIVGALRGRYGRVSIIVMAWVLIALIIAVTVFAMFGADPLASKMSRFFLGLGPNMVIGQGFGIAGQSVSSSIGAGLGLVGVALGGIVIMASIFQALVAERSTNDRVDSNVVMLFASLGAIVSSPGEVGVFGPVCIVFAAAAFSVSLSCVKVPKRRRALMATPDDMARNTIKAAQIRAISPRDTHRSPPSLNAMGLRPKR